MRVTMIAKSEAPAQGPDRRKRRIPEVEEMIGSLAAGTVARIELGEDEKPRPIIEQIYRSAARRGKIVDIWDVGGQLYVEELSGRAG